MKLLKSINFNFNLLLVNVMVCSLTVIVMRFIYERKTDTVETVEAITLGIKVEDVIAMSFWDKEDSDEIKRGIYEEHAAGKRDQYFIPSKYVANLNNSHFDDTGLRDEYQREVYLTAKFILKKLKLKEKRQMTVIDVGCGSGWKLVHFLSNEFKTIGIETEPAYSYLKRTYPNQTWYNADRTTSGVATEIASTIKNCDLLISADVVEHFHEPNFLMNVLKSYKCRFYVISTPMRESMSWNGPPGNIHHVREWNFQEFQIYLESCGFRVIRSFAAVRNPGSQFHVVELV